MTAPPAGAFDPSQSASYTYEPPQQGSKSRPALLVALAVVAALVIGGGAFAVTRALGGGGDQPASALPADTAAYLRLDIDPKVGQKIAAVRFFDALDDDALETLRSEDIRKEFFDWMAEEEEAFASIDYAEDIEPWLGDRMGLGIVPNGSDEPFFGIALQVKDEDAANEGLTKLQEATNSTSDDGLDWYFHGDYAVLTTTDAVGSLQDLVEEGTLADKDTFTQDMAALGDEGVVSGWVDVEPLAALVDSPLAQETLDDASALDATGALGSMAGTSQLASEAATGRYAAAVRFSENNIEVHGVTRGLEATGIEGGDSAQLILDLPEDTVGAFGLEHGDQLVANAYAAFQEQFPQEVTEAEQSAAEAGFTLPDDIQTLVGSSLVLSAGPGLLELEDLDDMQLWEVAYRSETDTDAAQDLLTRAFGAAGTPEADDFLIQRTDDGALTLGVSQSYVDAVAEGGTLGDTDLFKSAVPNAGDADSVFYVNINSLEHLYLNEVEDAEAKNALEQLAAVGFSAAADNEGNGEFTLRFVADE
ncbi:DUF3352 domain-containing protein [Ornithinimicrobium ciconiae]|uniref:DUF3352 domain-containing protein n=1 Tax=Ornithinimicrobium ciconiae TaxID=2594265 RepID=A0A516GEG1_9MICO|nr:DUF3352 domain-containing protein [Ornithinimicrobium ciconiae]QDO89895.1 DUF3352 domain-containing protein [Ornithinimicrobium ciconiae]